MKTAAILLSAALAAGLVNGAAAQTPAGEEPVRPYVQSDANAGAKPFEGDRMFKALHGKEGIDRIVTSLIAGLHADPRTADIFRADDDVRLHRTLVEQFCYLTGGPCHYGGMSMKEAHAHMGVQEMHFNVLVERLEDAMTREHVAFRDQAKILAKFAPMKRAVVDENPQ